MQNRKRLASRLSFILLSAGCAIGSLIFAIFCCSKRYGWGWDKLLEEADLLLHRSHCHYCDLCHGSD